MKNLAGLKITQANIFLFVISLVFVSYYVTLKDMFFVWWEDSSAYSHGLLLMPISLYIFYERWVEQKKLIEINVNYIFIIFLLIAGLLWFASHMVFVQAAEHLFFIGILFSVILASVGIKRGIPFIFPLILILATIPIWESVVSQLQLATTIFSAFLLDITGITSIREGYYLLIPAGTFEVAEGCSGLRYQLAGASIALLYIYMAQMRLMTGLLYMAIEVGVVFVANVVRIYIVVLIGDQTNMQSPLIDDHLWLGWVIFSIFIAVFIWLSNRVVPLLPPPIKPKNEVSVNASPKVMWTMVVILLVAVLPAALANVFSLEKYRDTLVTFQPPMTLGKWTLKENYYQDNWKIKYQQSNGKLTAYYSNENNSLIRVDILHYLFQEQGREAVYKLNKLYDKKSWYKQTSRMRQVSMPDSKNLFAVKETILKSYSGEFKLIWSWYYVNQKNVANDMAAKFENILSSIQGRPEVNVFIVSAKFNGNKSEAEHLLATFIKGELTKLNMLVESKNN